MKPPANGNRASIGIARGSGNNVTENRPELKLSMDIAQLECAARFQRMSRHC
jgi:hypothetical protein